MPTQPDIYATYHWQCQYCEYRAENNIAEMADKGPPRCPHCDKSGANRLVLLDTGKEVPPPLKPGQHPTDWAMAATILGIHGPNSLSQATKKLLTILRQMGFVDTAAEFQKRFMSNENST